MDPTEALAKARKVAKEIQEYDELEATEMGGMSALSAFAIALAQHFDDLDNWISGGGFLPEDWQHEEAGD